MNDAIDKYIQSIKVTAQWEPPMSLTEHQATSAPFPVYALPDQIRQAVTEISDFTKAPLGMIASSALNSLSIACQAYIDVSRGHKLTGPVSLFFLVIADPNERKSSVDRLFQEGISQWEAERLKLAGPDIDAYRLQERAWNAKIKGLESAIVEHAKKGRDTSAFEADLVALQSSKPLQPRRPVLIRIDDTQEALAYGLSTQWPACGIVSNEGALTLGSHSMSGDSLMRTLGLYNVLWDGGTYRATRIGRDDVYLSGVRLSVSIMIQEKLFLDFLERSDGMARGSGFFGRFLTCWPYSTQGIRLIDKEITETPKLDAFNAAIRDILDMPLPLDEDGRLSPPVCALTPGAGELWRDFYNAVERKVALGDEFSDTRDLAGKLAENAARLAALMEFFEGGRHTISTDNMDRGILIASWYGNEGRRIFGDSGLAEDLALPKKLSEWLVEYCIEKRCNGLPERYIRQYGPRALRKKSDLQVALRVLQQHHHVRVERSQGRGLEVQVNELLINSRMGRILG